MAQVSVNSTAWNTLVLLILITVWITLLIIDSRDYKVSKLHPKVITRQLKYHRDGESRQQLKHKPKKVHKNEIPVIYAITPTHYRVTQMADLTRLSNTLRQIERLHWIVVEDWKFTNHHVYELLKSTNMTFTYLAQRTRSTTFDLSKGVDQRNAALTWVERNHNWNQRGVVYFVDDDNSYDLRIFEEMRYTKKLSMWPVGLSGNRKVERPIVQDGKVVNFSAWWTEYRVFPMDMAGFAINVKVLWDYYPMRFETNPKDCCMLETAFLELCCTIEDIEPLANNCTKVYVWHTRTEKVDLSDYTPSYGEPYV